MRHLLGILKNIDSSLLASHIYVHHRPNKLKNTHHYYF